MELHSDFSQPVLLHVPQLEWTPSPMVGVHRRMLDRMGSEVARATTVVRYAEGSSFSPHTHGGGEEFFVLDGVFQDEHGEYPAGTYVRNPPTSRHTPRSDAGCTIFVKLWQFDPNDRHQMAIRMDDAPSHPLPDHPGVTRASLFENASEHVEFQQWEPHATAHRSVPGGAEIFVLDGELSTRHGPMKRHSWLRIPTGDRFEATAGPLGARVWMKTGHLRVVTAPAEPR